MADRQHTILTITGSDGTGDSGVQADIKTIDSFGGRAVSAITSITIQNTLGIQQFHDLPSDIVRHQIEAIINDVQPDIIKVGLIRSVATLNVIVDILKKYQPEYIIYVPTFIASNGERLTDNNVISAIQDSLEPMCDLIITHKSRAHGENNAYASAIAYYLSTGSTIGEAKTKAGEYVAVLHSRSEQLQGRAGELYHAFLNLTEQHFRSNSDVAYYAEQLNVSPRYLAQVCRKTAGQSPKQIIDEYLIRQIEKTLTTTQKTIQEIAYEMGFSSQAHLSKFFKKMRGVAPKMFRKQ